MATGTKLSRCYPPHSQLSLSVIFPHVYRFLFLFGSKAFYARLPHSAANQKSCQAATWSKRSLARGAQKCSKSKIIFFGRILRKRAAGKKRETHVCFVTLWVLDPSCLRRSVAHEGAHLVKAAAEGVSAAAESETSSSVQRASRKVGRGGGKSHIHTTTCLKKQRT